MPYVLYGAITSKHILKFSSLPSFFVAALRRKPHTFLPPTSCSVLCSLAYISLGLEDPVSALSYSSQLLDSPKLPGGLRFLGQLYASEALVHLGRVQESLQYLTPDSIGDISVVGSPAGRSH